MQLHVLIEEQPEGGFVAECPALPGCVSEGDTREEVIENIKDAIQSWLWAEDQKALEEKKPESTDLSPILVTV